MSNETEQAVERLDFLAETFAEDAAMPDERICPFSADFSAKNRDAIRLILTALAHSEAEARELKSSVVAFCAPHAARYAEDFGLPPGHLHPTHYDLLERCGARMADFTRATNKTEE